MNGSSLKHLADVADLARLDIEAAGITLRAGDGMLTAGYQGQYARGWRTIAIPESFDFEVSVSASRFKAIVAMFSEDDDVELRVLDSGLRLRTQSSNALLTYWGEVDDFAEIDKKQIELAARMPTSLLIEELTAAAAFVSDSQTQPALTGINLTFGAGAGLKIMAFDGGGALYASNVEAKVKGAGSITVPTQDFLVGARLIQTGEVIIAKPKGQDAIALYNPDLGSLFRSSAIIVPYPDVSTVMKPLRRQSFDVNSGMIRNLVLSAKVLDGGPDISVASRGGRVYFGSRGEAGTFTVSTKGEIDAKLHYDAETLDKVTKLGPVLKFSVPARPGQPTLVESDHRKCWVVTRV